MTTKPKGPLLSIDLFWVVYAVAACLTLFLFSMGGITGYLGWLTLGFVVFVTLPIHILCSVVVKAIEAPTSDSEFPNFFKGRPQNKRKKS